ncbi:MAG TPA: hypothetical protein VN541_03670 [Tepidisphaeraceae bacterium]|nr:hypothetical protein [Tepidisphaeraceae bacterium]
MKRLNTHRKREKLQTVGERLLAGMKEMDAWLDSGKPLEASFTARTVADLPPPSTYDARQIAALRHRIGASQAVFAQLIGASAPLVRAWEQGDRRPSAMARRLLDEVRRDPDRWAAMLKDARRQPAA